MQMDLSNEWSTLSKSVRRDGERDCVILPHCRIVHGWENEELQRVTSLHLLHLVEVINISARNRPE